MGEGDPRAVPPTVNVSSRRPLLTLKGTNGYEVQSERDAIREGLVRKKVVYAMDEAAMGMPGSRGA